MSGIKDFVIENGVLKKYKGKGEDVVIPNSVTRISDSAFLGCTNLTKINIPDNVTSIGDVAFEGCTNLATINIPDNITSIGGGAFCDTAYYNNKSNWENGILYLGNILIKAKDNVSGEHNIKSGAKTIVGGAFLGCTNLTTINIPDSVTSIGDGAFLGCTNLTKINIPDSVTSIGEWAFCNTAYFYNESNWENGGLYIGNHLIYANGTLSGGYVIKPGTKTIAESTFSWFKNVTTIDIPDSVTSIGNDAFFCCENLTTINIPNSVTSIGYDTFKGCEDLTIHAPAGSYAEQYAKENGINFVAE